MKKAGLFFYYLLLLLFVFMHVCDAEDISGWTFEYKQRFIVLLSDYKELTVKKKESKDGRRIKIELFQLMQDALRKKQKLFEKRARNYISAYERAKQNADFQEELIDIHSKISKYAKKIDEIEQYIRLYDERRDKLIKKEKSESTVIITTDGVIEKKNELVEIVKPLIKQEANLVVSGASPSELVAYRQQIEFLKKEIAGLNAKIGFSSQQTLDEWEHIVKEADLIKDSTEERIKQETEKYSYRFDRQMVTQDIPYKRINNKKSKSEEMRYSEDQKVDQRLNAVRRDINVATE